MFYKPGSLPEPGGPELAFLDPPPGGSIFLLSSLAIAEDGGPTLWEAGLCQ